MKKPLNRQHAHIQKLFEKMKSDEDNKSFFRHILNKVLKQPFTIIEMCNEKSSLLYNRDYKALNKGTQYIVIEYCSDENIIETIYVGIKGNNRKTKGVFYTGMFNPFGYSSPRSYRIYPRNTFYMITV